MNPDINELYKEHGKYVYNIAYRMLSNSSDAEDVCHDVFMKLQTGLSSFNGNSAIKTYIYRITVNQSIDYIRKQQSLSSRAEKSVDRISGASKTKDDTLILDNLLNLIDPQSRACILLYEVGGFSQKEIARIMNTRTGTVKSRISRSIKKMSEHLEKEDSKNALQKRNTILLPER
jgi:RNA polymerase sigma-70 factor (ECF subfamily)